jgi:hypothetical protein
VAATTNATVANLAEPLAIKPDVGPIQYLRREGQAIAFPAPFTLLQFTSPAALATGVSLTVSLAVGFGNYSLPDSQRVSPFFHERIITRPANVTPYAANQYVGAMPDGAGKYVLFSNVFRLGSRYSRLTRAMIRKTSATVTNAQFSLWLFQSPGQITAAGTDQTTFAPSANDDPVMGRVQFPLFMTGGAGSAVAFCDVAGLDIHLRQLAGSPFELGLYGVLVADAAYVPASGESLTVSLWGDQLG